MGGGGFSDWALPAVGAIAGTTLLPGVGTAMGAALGGAGGMLANEVLSPPEQPEIDFGQPSSLEPVGDGLDDALSREQPSLEERRRQAALQNEDGKTGRESTLLTSPDMEDKEPSLKKKTLLGE